MPPHWADRPLCVLPVVYRPWDSVRLRHLDDWLTSWLPCSVFSAVISTKTCP